MVIDNIIFINLQKLSKLVQYWMSYGSAKFGLDARRRSIKLCRATTSSISGVRPWFLHINVANDVDYHIRDRYICTSSWSQLAPAVVVRCQISYVHIQRAITSWIQCYFNRFLNYMIAFESIYMCAKYCILNWRGRVSFCLRLEALPPSLQ
jgi:hypothetical protein